MNYPLNLSFKLFAIASQIYIRDVNNNLFGYVKQKLFKLKEDINVFADEGQTRLLFNIKADRIIDFSARYNFTDGLGNYLGAVKRQGMRSIWRARYNIFDPAGRMDLQISEENGWIKVGDALFNELPVVGMLTGYFFNPTYLVTGPDGSPLARLKKQPAFFEGKFQLEKLGNFSEELENRVLLAVLTMTILERARG